MIKRFIKRLVTNVLAHKAATALKDGSPFVIVVIGERLRSLFRDQLHDQLITEGYGVLVNQPGMNYRLGTSLTLLQLPIGGSSWRTWLRSVLSELRPLPYDIYIQEFAAQNEEDVAFITHLFPDAHFVATPDTQSHLIDALMKSVTHQHLVLPCETGNEGTHLYGAQENCALELTAATEEDAGTTVQYRINDERVTTLIPKFSEHYLYPTIIAHYLARIYEDSKNKIAST